MQQFLKTKEVRYNVIFHSAFKALIVFQLLMESPKTLDQLCEALKKTPYIKPTISKDTLRVYINSFKVAGCNVVKKLTKEKRREYAYFIEDNPFRPIISEAQTKKLFEIYDIIMYNMTFEELLNVDLLFQKFNHCLKNEYFAELYEKHSLLKEMDFEMLRTLEQCCKENSLVTVLYNSPRSGLKEIPIVAHKMKVQNYKLYIEGFGLEYKEEAIFLVNRIAKITNIVPSEEVNLPQDNAINVICEFYDTQTPLEDNETVVDTDTRIRTVIHKTTNKLLSIQRFLQLADSCKILEPVEFREEFINALKSAKGNYEDRE
ncbi:MAG: hypothetical protein NC390_06530 [Fusobacterium sp.]|nr:hypothetical protein [Fusobacterium sp.]